MSYLIEKVVQDGLCVSCGTCVGVCPEQAIMMHLDAKDSNYYPIVDNIKCTNCGACGAVCPGHIVNFNDLDRFMESSKRDPLMGKFIECYMGHSSDEIIRYESTSGGIISSLLIDLLETEVINGVIVIKMKENNPLETVAQVARTREEVLKAARSKYCPATPNVLLSEIKKSDGKYAVVGLPCQLHGVRKAELRDDELREKIILHLGLMCSHTVNFAGTKFVLEKLGIRKDDVENISYRGYGWPGGLKGSTINGEDFFIPLFGKWRSYWPVFSSFFFSPLRCIMCPDQTAEYADISFGDAWLPEARGDKIGESVIVTRTIFADNLVNELNKRKILELQQIDSGKIIESQALNLKFKKKDLNTRLKILKRLGYKTPHYKGLENYSFSVLGTIRGIYALINIKLSSHRSIRRILRYVPFPFFRLYFGIYKILSII